MMRLDLRIPITVASLLFLMPLPPAAAAPEGKAAPKGAKAAPGSVPAPAPVDSKLFWSLKPRSIGPAVMSGRVADIALDPKDPATFYVGLGTGGVMKTSDAGQTFSGIFDGEAVAAVGSVAVHPAEPKIVWVGTGEGNDRNSSSWGNGVYRSDDSGGTWKHLGLDASRNIPRIALHPTNTDVAYVASLGDLWSWSKDRGLFKTTDGGKTWKLVLKAEAPYDERVGCGDVAMDPSNPDVLYAAMYARRRTPWSFTWGADATDGKDVGGIFKSTDGGATWKKLAQGLPTRTGRIGLDVYRKDPKTVLAIVQSDEHGTSDIDEIRARSGGVYRSDDGGATWTRTSPLNPRPFYFSKIKVDPVDAKRVYVLGYLLHVSDDGGKTFREDLFKKVHADCHALVVDPANGSRLLLGTDGGVYASWNGGKGWELLNKFAAGQFYRVNVDDGAPYRICGGLQDNTNWMGPSRTWTKDGIQNGDWTEIGGGDGFYCVFDSEDKDVVYAESQGGEVHRFNFRTGEIKDRIPKPAEGQPAFRFHWNSPLIGSRHEKGALYLAGNRIFKLTDRLEKWQMISPDLSATREPDKVAVVGSGAENYAVVYTLAESPKRAGMLWAGTDDGKLWLTEDDGKNWKDLTASLPAEARGQWISRVEASWHDPKVAYLAVDAHRTGSFVPLAWRTEDGGKTWRKIVTGIPDTDPVKVVREDPVNPDLLFAGTEFGLYASLDRGERWSKWPGLPTVAVDDLVVHPSERDLVIATHGRSLFVIDDLRSVEALTEDVRSKSLWVFEPREAFGRHLLRGWEDSAGTAVYRGENPPAGALLQVWIGEVGADPLKVEIANAGGHTVAAFTVQFPPAGINRVVWDLKPSKDYLTEYGGEGALFVPSGEYTVTATRGKDSHKQTLKVTIAEGLETR